MPTLGYQNDAPTGQTLLTGSKRHHRSVRKLVPYLKLLLLLVELAREKANVHAFDNQILHRPHVFQPKIPHKRRVLDDLHDRRDCESGHTRVPIKD